METERSFYRVLDSRFPELVERIGKLNRRATKLGVAPVVINNVGTETVKLVGNREVDMLYVPRSDETVLGTRTYQHLVAVGQTPKLAGWSFIGTLQHLKDDETDEALTVLRAVPGESIPHNYRVATQWCDQCRVFRQRRDTYVVRNETGEYKQVGSDCIKDFLGGVSPEQILAALEILLSAQDMLGASDDFGGMGFDDLAIWRDSYLEHVAAIVRTTGWLSRTKAREFGGQATADAALEYFVSRKRDSLPKLEITDEDRKLVEQAVAWGKSLTGVNRDGTTNDYEWNLRVSLSSETLKARTEGIAASVIASFNRHQARELRMAWQAKDSKSEFVGTVGKREVFEVMLTAEPMYHESDWGGYFISKFLHANQNEIVWFGSKLDVEVGVVIKVKATVKRHEERNGVKQTVVNRVMEVK